MIREEFIDYAKRKKLTGKLLIIFIVVITILTFFSNTINNFMLPRVTTDSSTGGALIKEISGQGTIEAKCVLEQYTDSNLVVKDINVQAGDAVKAGQVIMSLDIDDLKANLQDENAKYKQMQIAIDKLKDSGNLLTLNNNIQTALENKDQKTKEYQDVKKLYDSGAKSEADLENAKTAMGDAQRNYDLAVQTKDAFIRNNKRDIENAQLNLDMEARKIDALKKQVENDGVYKAPTDGIITELNFTKGSMANNSKPLFKLAEASGGFQLEVPVDRSLADYVKVGDEVDVDITSLGDKIVKGKVSQIRDNIQNDDSSSPQNNQNIGNTQDGDNKKLLIDVNDSELQGGENAQVDISKKTKQYRTLVPNSAVYTDDDGTYILVVRQKDSPLGTQNYVQRVDVTVDDSDNTKTAITNMLTPMDKIVTGSTKSLSDGDRVVLQ